MGRSGCVTVSDGPKRQRRAAISASSSSFTVRATADEVQISASHGMTGAVSSAGDIVHGRMRGSGVGDAAQAVGGRPCAQAQACRFRQARAGQIERADLAEQVEAVGRQPACLSGRIERTHQGREGLAQIPGPGVRPHRLTLPRPATAARRKAFPAAWRPISQGPVRV